MEKIERILRDAEIHLCEEQWEDRKGIFLKPPERIPTETWTDAPLLGNGDVGIAIGGGPEEQTFYIGKGDFWVQPYLGETAEQRVDRLLNDQGRRTGARMITVGQLSLSIPDLNKAKYRQEQDILNAEVKGFFHGEQVEVNLCSWVAADSNMLVNELECVRGKLDILMKLHAGEKTTNEVFNYENGVDDDSMWFRYATNSTNVPETRRVAVVNSVLGRKANYQWNFHDVEAQISMVSGDRIVILTAIVSNRDKKDYFNAARNLVETYGQKDRIVTLKRDHRNWWRRFWTASHIEIGDPVLEKYYYASYYIIGSCIRAGKTPPGLFGNWITTDRPAWTGSYTMNYNYEAPFWGLYAGNRVDLAESYCEPLLAFLPLGKKFAREKLNCRGIYMPVELGADGMVCSMFFHGQKSNAAFATVNLLMHIYHTYDMDYARKVYPFLMEVGNFWEDYLVFENNCYVIYNDDIHERSKDKKNPILSLGFIRMIFMALLDLSVELKCDERRREKWRHILDHLSPYPILERNGKTVFRLTEEGMDWNHRNSLAVQHVFPAGVIGLDSPSELLTIAWDTVDEMQRWSDFNAFPTYYAAAARVGYDPRVILDRLRTECKERSLENLSIHHGGGGIEDASAVPVCLQEMLLQSHQKTIRLFPVWPDDQPASFRKLRAVGAFLVSSAYSEGSVKYVLVESEKGRTCRIQNPWPEERVVVYCNHYKEVQVPGEYIELETKAGDQLVLFKDD